jgi:hypothetical protein
MKTRWGLALLTIVACSRNTPPEAARSAVVALPPSPSGVGSSEAEASLLAPADSAPEASTPRAATDAAVPAAPLEGEDFIAQADVIFRVAACGGSLDGATAKFDREVVAHHCDDLKRAYEDYRREWLALAEPFFASIRPANLPGSVVYPFGGGDLTSALATFPDASEITTISLEPAGDVRSVDRLSGERLGKELAEHRAHLERLFVKAHSRTENLEKEAHTELPGEILFALGALVVHGAEPTSLRYFRIRPDGSLHYVTAEDIAAASHHPRALRTLFENAELRFRRSGDAGGAVQLLRHVSFNLDDEHLRGDGSLLAYLDARGKVAAMTKAASHLLWSGHFSIIRDWLLGHTDWMVSDSTGIPPRFLKSAGFAQRTYGDFDGPALFGLYNESDSRDFKALFASQEHRELAFRYGYPDRNGHAHLVVTERSGRQGN